MDNKESLPLSVKVLGILFLAYPIIGILLSSIAALYIGSPEMVVAIIFQTIIAIIFPINTGYGLLKKKYMWGRWSAYFLSSFIAILALVIFFDALVTRSLLGFVYGLILLPFPILSLYIYFEHDKIFIREKPKK